MFILSEMRSMVRLEASEFGQPLTEAVIECLNNKLSNKILKDVGLVIALWDVIEVGESFIMPGSSGSHTKAHFRLKDFSTYVCQMELQKQLLFNHTKKDMYIKSSTVNIWFCDYG